MYHTDYFYVSIIGHRQVGSYRSNQLLYSTVILAQNSAMLTRRENRGEVFPFQAGTGLSYGK